MNKLPKIPKGRIVIEWKGRRFLSIKALNIAIVAKERGVSESIVRKAIKWYEAKK